MRLQNFLQFFLLFIYVQSASSNTNVSTTEKVEEEFLRQIYTDMDKGLKNVVKNSVKSALRVFIEWSQELNISTNCMTNGFRLLTGLRDLNLWAISFIDASGKLSGGFLSGSSHMLGNYDQCLNSSGLKKNGDVDFRGKYCLISYRPYLPKTDKILRFQDRMALIEKLTENLTSIIKLYVLKSEFTKSQNECYGLCIPSGCEEKDVSEILHYVEKKILMNLTMHYCHTEESLTKLTPRRIAIICFFSVFGLLAVIGSLLEYYFELYNIKNEHFAMKILSCFSLKTNFPKFIKTETHDTKISCVSGIRVLTLFYIILGHHYMSSLVIYVMSNSMSAIGTINQFFMQIVLNGFLSVDVFFFVGGFLNCYTRMNFKTSSTSVLNSFMLIIHRLLRIIPTYVACILFSMLLIPRGPMSETANRQFDLCKTEWWKNILFINNFYGEEAVCFPHSWYLANDMQYFLVSLITISLLKKYPKIGAIVNLFIIIFSTVLTAVWVWMKDLPPTFLFANITHTELKNVYSAYILPFSHAAPYFSGVLLGHFLATRRNLKLPRITQVLGTAIFVSMFLFLLFATKRWNSGVRYSKIESALYFSLSRPLYAMSVGWLIFYCFIGQGGFINYILSLKVWIPLCRVSLSAYLVSYPLQRFFLENSRTTVDMQRMKVIWTYLGDLTVTCLLALCITMLFESPFLALEKVIFSKRIRLECNDDTIKENELNSFEKQKSTNNIIAMDVTIK